MNKTTCDWIETVNKHESNKLRVGVEERFVKESHKFVKTWVARADDLVKTRKMKNNDISFEDYTYYLKNIRDEVNNVLDVTDTSMVELETLSQTNEQKLKVRKNFNPIHEKKIFKFPNFC